MLSQQTADYTDPYCFIWYGHESQINEIQKEQSFLTKMQEKR